MNKLACVLMLKNENKYVYGEKDKKPSVTMLEQQMMFLKSFVDNVYIMDDLSDDGSMDIYKKYQNMGLVKEIISTNGEFDENKHYNTLCDMVKSDEENKWMLYLDGDEILIDESRKYIRDLVEDKINLAELFNDKQYLDKIIVRFRYINLWRSRKQYRYDKFYGGETGKLFRVHKTLKSYGKKFNEHHFAYEAPDDFGRIILLMDHFILHYAWVDWNHMIRKVDRNAVIEYKYNGTNIDEAKKHYMMTLDETDIRYRNCVKAWAEEYRTGKISYV